MSRLSPLAELDLPVPIGSTIAGKYRVEKVLGTGGMGIVAVGRHLRLRQKVAIKMLRPAALAEPEIRARFTREAIAASRMKTEHVARVTDVGETEEGVPFIIMEYLEGDDLAEIGRKRGALPTTEAVDYILQACEALAEAHRCGIVHRDLKPANIFVTKAPDGSPLVKVLDFGISKLRSTSLDTEALTRSEVIIGSPQYMSPEQLRCARDVDERADIWALGAVLYKLLSCEVPFPAETTVELCVAVLTQDPRPLEELVPGQAAIGAVVQRCLRRNPDERFASVVELAEALAPFATDEGRSSVSRVVRVASRRTSIPPSSGGESELAAKTTIDADPNGPTNGTATSSQFGLPKKPHWPSIFFGGLLFVVLVVGGGTIYVLRSRAPLPASRSAAPPAVAAPAVTEPAVVMTSSAVPTPAETAASAPTASANPRRNLAVRQSAPKTTPTTPTAVTTAVTTAASASASASASAPPPTATGTSSSFDVYGGRR